MKTDDFLQTISYLEYKFGKKLGKNNLSTISNLLARNNTKYGKLYDYLKFLPRLKDFYFYKSKLEDFMYAQKDEQPCSNQQIEKIGDILKTIKILQ